MPKPTLPTQQEMRDWCRTTEAGYTNISREVLILEWGDKDTEHVNRWAAEDWEDVWLNALTPAEQDVYIDWYIDWYRGARRTKPYARVQNGDPNAEIPAYGLAGYVTGRWRDPTVCECTFYMVGASPGATPDVLFTVLRQGPEHSLSGQALHDTVYGESSRKSATLKIIEDTINLETKDDRTTWRFLDTRIGATDERVLEVTISGTNKQQRDGVEDAAALMFGSGAVVVL